MEIPRNNVGASPPRSVYHVLREKDPNCSISIFRPDRPPSPAESTVTFGAVMDDINFEDEISLGSLRSSASAVSARRGKKAASGLSRTIRSTASLGGDSIGHVADLDGEKREKASLAPSPCLPIILFGPFDIPRD